MKVVDKTKNPIAVRNSIGSSGDKTGDNADNRIANEARQPRLAKTLARAGMRSTVSEHWSQFSARERQLIFSLLGLFIGVFICCGCYVVESLQQFTATREALFLFQAKLLAVFPAWYVLGFLGLPVLAGFFAVLFNRAGLSRRLAVAASVVFLCFTGVSFWCSRLSAALRGLGGAENAVDPFFFLLAPRVVCACSLLWGWHVAWATRRGWMADKIERTTKGEVRNL